MDTPALRSLGSTVVDWRFKGMPPASADRTVDELTGAGLDLFTAGFLTPLLTLDADALRHNLELLARWSAEHGLALAPHGKTTLAPELFRRQLELGAWGITAAMPSHVRMYRAFGVRRIFLANELVDPAALGWLSAELDADPEFRFVCYVDSEPGLRLMEDALTAAAGRRKLDVVVELGANGARTGVRGVEAAVELAALVADSPVLRLVGVAGYEGTIAAGPDRGEVADWLAALVELAHRVDAAGHFAAAGPEGVIVSAGGSEHFDLVAAALTADALKLSSGPVLRLLRSGAYVTHDHLHYAGITPLRAPAETLRPALRLWAQVVSRPEPGLALLNAGKRDLPYDLGLPIPLLVRSQATGEVREAVGLTVDKLADQHAFVTVGDAVGDGAGAGAGLAVGDWVALGLSHPCTAIEKWQLIPEVAADGTVTDYIRTFF